MGSHTMEQSALAELVRGFEWPYGYYLIGNPIATFDFEDNNAYRVQVHTPNMRDNYNPQNTEASFYWSFYVLASLDEEETLVFLTAQSMLMVVHEAIECASRAGLRITNPHPDFFTGNFDEDIRDDRNFFGIQRDHCADLVRVLMDIAPPRNT